MTTYFDRRPDQPTFSAMGVDDLPLADAMVIDEYREGELIYQFGSAGSKWRILWDERNGRWCKRAFVPYAG